VLSLLLAVAVVWTLEIRTESIRQPRTRVYVRDVPQDALPIKYQVGVLSKCKSTITKLTKADRSCHQYMKERRDEFAQALRDPRNQEQGGSTDFFDLDRQELDLENNYRMKNNEMFAYTITILILTLIGMSLVVWLPWYEWKVPVTSPGIIALAGAICLIIIVRKEEKIIQAIDLQTLLFVAAYRYTTQTLLSVTVLDWLSDTFRQINTLHSSGYMLTFFMTWFSGLMSTLTGVENFSPDMLNIVREIFSPNEQAMVICQTVGSLLAGNALLYASIGNIVGANFTKKHGLHIRSAAFARLGLPITLVTGIGASCLGFIYQAAKWT